MTIISCFRVKDEGAFEEVRGEGKTQTVSRFIWNIFNIM